MSLETDKQLVELIHVRALNALCAHQQSGPRYQSVTLFLRGKSTSGASTSTHFMVVSCICLAD